MEGPISGVTRERVVVVGGGPTGLAAALALTHAGQPVLVLAPPDRTAPPDRRTAALFAGSITLMRNLGVWPACAAVSSPILAIRIIDDTGGVLRAPEVVFTAAEVGLEAFGYNVPNADLTLALRTTLAARGGEIAETSADRIAVTPNTVRLLLATGATIETLLVVGADGRHSPSRQAAGIATRAWSYPQAAVVCSFGHARPHHGASTEFHRPAGPLTTVPLPGNRSSLVWVERPGEGERLSALDDTAFARELEARLQGLLGLIADLGPRSVFPLSGLSAQTAAANRVALVGEASHVIPPIGAQGLNLGLRDAAALADCVGGAIGKGRDPGGQATLEAYAAARATDVSTRVIGVDLLNRSLIADVLPTHLARGLGLHLINAIGPLRRYLVREGLQPSRATPSLMRDDATSPLPQNGGTAGGGRRSGP